MTIFKRAAKLESRDPLHSLNFQFCKDYFDGEAVSHVVHEYSRSICRGESQSSISLCSQTSLSVVPLRNSSDLLCFALSRETTDEVYFIVIQYELLQCYLVIAVLLYYNYVPLLPSSKIIHFLLLHYRCVCKFPDSR